MSDFRIFDIAGSAMAAQSVRLNTVASNLANADSVSSDPSKVYHARQPLFAALAVDGDPSLAGVQVQDVVQNAAEPQKRYEPGHPQANAEGYVYAPNVNPVEEMVNLISAARSYQSSVEVLNTSKDLMLRTLSIGK